MKNPVIPDGPQGQSGTQEQPHSMNRLGPGAPLRCGRDDRVGGIGESPAWCLSGAQAAIRRGWGEAAKPSMNPKKSLAIAGFL